VATTALLLGGDAVEVSVELGHGARLELGEVAGTVAYAGRGASATWRLRILLAADAQLVLRGEPFVVADGAKVTRSLDLDLAPGASAVLRDTLILGRSGEIGGALRNSTTVRRDGREVLVEDQDLDPTRRGRPGVLGGVRVVDTLLGFGIEPGPALLGADRFVLAEPGSTLTRFLGTSLAASPLTQPQVLAPGLD